MNLIPSIIEASIVTAGIYVGLLLFKRKQKPIFYIIIFCAALFGALIFGSSLHADLPPDPKTEQKQVRIYLNTLRAKLDKEDKKFYQSKVRFHQSNAERCYNDVKNKCAWLPSFDDRENAKFCLITAGTLVAPTDPMSKLMAVTVELFVYYGLNVIDEWKYIKNKMHWAEYHYEMMEFYQDILRRG